MTVCVASFFYAQLLPCPLIRLVWQDTNKTPSRAFREIAQGFATPLAPPKKQTSRLAHHLTVLPK